MNRQPEDQGALGRLGAGDAHRELDPRGTQTVLVTGTAYAWWWLAALLGGLGILGQAAAGVGLARWLMIPPAYGFLRPLGILILVGILLNSVLLILSGHDTTSKGRLYRRAATES